MFIVGTRQNMEVILYNHDSIFGRVLTIRSSPDPVAVSIAQQELLELLHVAPNVYDDPEALLGNATFSNGGPNLTAVVETA